MERSRRIRRWLLRVIACCALPFVVYGLFLIIGCWPVNRDFVPTPDGVTIYVSSSPVHTDLIVPIDNEIFGWDDSISAEVFPADIDWATHYAIGWGDRGFYLETPTWNDLKVSTAFKALALPSGTVIHVQATARPDTNPAFRAIKLSAEQYLALCESIHDSFPNGQPKVVAGEHYNDYDAFFESQGSYSCFNTCNSWAGDRMKNAGVCVPLWTPLPGSTTWYLD